MAHAADAVAGALHQKRSARFLHQVRAVIRSRTIDTNADPYSGLLQVADRTATGSKCLVAAGAMADRRASPCKSLHFGLIEVDAVSEPGSFIEPAAVFEIVKRPAAMNLQAVAVLVLRFPKMSMHANARTFGKLRG